MILYVWEDGELQTFRTSDGLIVVAELSETDRDNILARKKWPALYACADRSETEAAVRKVLNLVREGAGD